MCNLLLLGEELNVQLQNSFGSIFLMLSMKVARGGSKGKSLAPDS